MEFEEDSAFRDGCSKAEDILQPLNPEKDRSECRLATALGLWSGKYPIPRRLLNIWRQIWELFHETVRPQSRDQIQDGSG